MKTYSVKPEGINPIKKRMLMFGAAAMVIVLASVGTVMPGALSPLRYGVVGLFVVIFGGFGFYRALRRMNETWPSYTLTMTDDAILKRQSHYPDIRIARDEVKAIWRSASGEIVVKIDGVRSLMLDFGLFARSLLNFFPIRDGNGRVARMLSILMGLQAGLPALDFGDIKGKKKEYFSAVQAGLDRNYEPMERIFTGVIGRTLRIHGR